MIGRFLCRAECLSNNLALLLHSIGQEPAVKIRPHFTVARGISLAKRDQPLAFSIGRGLVVCVPGEYVFAVVTM